MTNSTLLLTPARGGLIVLFAALIGGISNLFGLLIQPRRG
jgi:hypothetical protein